MFLDTPISANPQTSDLIQNQIIPGLKIIVGFIAQWAVPLAAIGSVSMALIQAAKNQTPIRNYFQQFKLRQWLRASILKDYTDGKFARFSNRLKRRFGGDQEIRQVQEEHLRNIEQELILLATSGDTDAFYDLQIEDMCDQIRKVVSVILDYPTLHEDLLVCLARGAAQADIKRILGKGESAILDPQSQNPEPEKQIFREYAAAKNRILVQIRCSVDAIQNVYRISLEVLASICFDDSKRSPWGCLHPSMRYQRLMRYQRGHGQDVHLLELNPSWFLGRFSSADRARPYRNNRAVGLEMNDKLLDALFSRRKEAVTRLAFCLFVSALLAVAGRIPILFVSLPAAWISGGLSIAFIWVIGPPILIVLQAYALHGIFEAEQLRRLLTQQSSLDPSSNVSVSPQLGEELTPIWRTSSPPIIHLALCVTMLAPTIANFALFGSYLQFVRPGNEMASRRSQTIDALVGKRGWGWFKPIAPSLQGNLKELENSAAEPDKTKYHNLATEVPWIEFPVLTWAYLFLLVISVDGAVVGVGSLAGASVLEHSLVYGICGRISDKIRGMSKRRTKRDHRHSSTKTRESDEHSGSYDE